MDKYYRVTRAMHRRLINLRKDHYCTMIRTISHLQRNIWVVTDTGDNSLTRYAAIWIARGELREITTEEAWKKG